MLQADHLTWAPNCVRVSMRTWKKKKRISDFNCWNEEGKIDTYGRLCVDVSAPDDLGSFQRPVFACPSPQSHNSGHFWFHTFRSLLILQSLFLCHWILISFFLLLLSNLLPCSAMSISFRPEAAWLIFLTQKSVMPFDVCWAFSRGEISSSSDELPV